MPNLQYELSEAALAWIATKRPEAAAILASFHPSARTCIETNGSGPRFKLTFPTAAMFTAGGTFDVDDTNTACLVFDGVSLQDAMARPYSNPTLASQPEPIPSAAYCDEPVVIAKFHERLRSNAAGVPTVDTMIVAGRDFFDRMLARELAAIPGVRSIAKDLAQSPGQLVGHRMIRYNYKGVVLTPEVLRDVDELNKSFDIVEAFRLQIVEAIRKLTSHIRPEQERFPQEMILHPGIYVRREAFMSSVTAWANVWQPVQF